MSKYGRGSDTHIPALQICAGCLNALLIFGACGLTGVLLDLDHFLAAIWRNIQQGKPPLNPYDLVANIQGRPLHIPIVVVSGIIFCIALARYARFLYVVVVDKK